MRKSMCGIAIEYKGLVTLSVLHKLGTGTEGIP